MTIKLHDLRPAPGEKKAKTRVGRGEGSKGKTAGRGTKGTGARKNVPVGFEGGQMPIHRRLPKRGFNKPNALQFNAVNLDRIQTAIDAGKLDAKAPVDAAALVAAGVIRRPKDGVRILSRGELKAKVAFKVAGVSAAAKEAIEKAGGSVEVLAPAKGAGEDGAKA